MGEFGILTNRKRAVIALLHSVVFLSLATWQATATARAQGMSGGVHVSSGTLVLCGIYVIVSAILLWLFAISRGWVEKLYFALCTVSAASGLLRTILGDHTFHAGRMIRVLLLMAAVIVGTIIVRAHSQLIAGKSEA
jgi:hypothetical protein